MRAVFKKLNAGKNKDFRFRGRNSGRLENFSDAVFALAITLLLISTSPPNNFEEIKIFVWELIPFSLCIALIMLIWNQHFMFFYRYGLRNSTVLVLNTIFLVIVLFYVYPLKYLTRGILIPIGALFNQRELVQRMQEMYQGSSVADLLIIYGLGVATVFFVLAYMYRYALKMADSLELNPLEKFDTNTSMVVNILLGSVPLVSVTIAVVMHNHRLVGVFSGFSYWLYPIVMGVFSNYNDRKRKALLNSETTVQV